MIQVGPFVIDFNNNIEEKILNTWYNQYYQNYQKISKKTNNDQYIEKYSADYKFNLDIFKADWQKYHIASLFEDYLAICDKNNKILLSFLGGSILNKTAGPGSDIDVILILNNSFIKDLPFKIKYYNIKCHGYFFTWYPNFELSDHNGYLSDIELSNSKNYILTYGKSNKANFFLNNIEIYTKTYLYLSFIKLTNDIIFMIKTGLYVGNKYWYQFMIYYNHFNKLDSTFIKKVKYNKLTNDDKKQFIHILTDMYNYYLNDKAWLFDFFSYMEKIKQLDN